MSARRLLDGEAPADDGEALVDDGPAGGPRASVDGMTVERRVLLRFALPAG
ncbi:hypothetical protein [Geodermatophilus sp. SYSU D01105]